VPRCYLLHFSEPLGDPDNPRGQALHYLGCTDRAIERRLLEHHKGQGSYITKAARKKGITFTCVRVWEGFGFDEEQELKTEHNNKTYCRICNPAIDTKVRQFVMKKRLEEVLSRAASPEEALKVCLEVLQKQFPDSETIGDVEDVLIYKEWALKPKVKKPVRARQPGEQDFLDEVNQTPTLARRRRKKALVGAS
jgi:predicted GIY-YIG superfamily endonuclease